MTTVSTEFKKRLLKGAVSQVRLDLGAERDRAPGWISVDIEAGSQPDILHDLRQGIPFLDGSVSAVYARHFLEHLNLTDGIALLRECYRALAPGAPIRIAVPDLELFAGKYARRDTRFFARDYAAEGGPWNDSITESFLAMLYGWGHRCAYDFELLRRILTEIGFARVTRSREGNSRHEAFRTTNLDNRPRQSLFVEAEKPGRPVPLPTFEGEAVPRLAGAPRGDLPRIGVCVPVPSWKLYCWPLLAKSLAAFDYPADCLELLVLLDSDDERDEQALREHEEVLHAAFSRVRIEVGRDVETRLRRQDALTVYSPRSFGQITHLTRLRQRALEYFLPHGDGGPDALLFLDADSLWGPETLHRLVLLSRERSCAAVGVLPYRPPEKHLLLFWCPNPPEGRLLAYNPPDVPGIPFPVDFATMGGTLVPSALLREFDARGGWYPYPVSGYPNRSLGDDVYLFLGSGSRLPLWVDPMVEGCHVESDGRAQVFRYAADGHGAAAILDRTLDLSGSVDQLAPEMDALPSQEPAVRER